MNEFFVDNIIWVVCYPLYVALLIGVARFFAVKMSNKLISVLTVTGSLIGLIFSLGMLPVAFSDTPVVETMFSFVKINSLNLQVGYAVDTLAAVCLCLLFFVSFIVQIFSLFYMKKEPKAYRFFAYLNLFNFGMAMFIVSPNLFQSYVAWEMIGVVSYLLIGFKYENISKSIASMRVFITNRVGDVAFLAGILSLVYIMLNYAPLRFVSLDYSDMNLISAMAYAHTNEATFLILCLLFCIGAFVKSAQFPTQKWLLDAMEAPTPVSALIHSATLVTAGVFITIRMLPLFTLSNTVMAIIAVFGLFTALFSSFCATTQVNVKKLLAYSTSANLGIVFALIGFGNVILATVYLLFHGILKAGLFLSYGFSNNEYEHRDAVIIPPLFVILVVVLSGLSFSGINLKENIFEVFEISPLFAVEILIVIFLAAFYMFRISCLYSGDKSLNTRFRIGVILWVFLSAILSGSIIKPPFVCALLGAIAGVVVARKQLKSDTEGCIRKLLMNGFYIDKLYSFTANFYKKLCCVAENIEFRMTSCKFLIVILKSFVKLAAWIEKYLFEFPIRLLSIGLRFASKEFDIVQTKNAQTYIAYGALIVGVIFTTILLTYSIVLNFLGGM